MSREYYSKEDIIEIYLSEGKKFEFVQSYNINNEPYFLEASFLGYDFNTKILRYRFPASNKESIIHLDDIIQLSADYTYSYRKATIPQ